MRIEVSPEGDGGQVTLTLSRSELGLLLGSFNEAIEAVEDWEFSTRLGVDMAEARRVRGELGALVRALRQEG